MLSFRFKEYHGEGGNRGVGEVVWLWKIASERDRRGDGGGENILPLLVNGKVYSRGSVGSALQVGLTAAAVPDVKNLDRLQSVVNPVIDRVGGVKYLSDAGPGANLNAHAGKRTQDLDVVKKAVAEALGCRGKVGPAVFEDALKIG
jgi:hypothetical protein